MLKAFLLQSKIKGVKVFNRYLILLCLFSAALHAATASVINKINLDWFSESYTEIEQAIESRSENELVPIVNTLGLVWVQRDGATSGEISPLMAKLLVAQPHLMLAVLADYPDEFQKCLSELQGSLLTDYSGTESIALDKMRQKLIQVMTSYVESHDNELQTYAKMLADKLSTLEVRVVD